jgi:hypothetical protein
LPDATLPSRRVDVRAVGARSTRRSGRPARSPCSLNQPVELQEAVPGRGSRSRLTTSRSLFCFRALAFSRWQCLCRCRV